MSEPVRDLDAALQSVADRWDGARTERTLEGLHRKQKRRRSRALLGAAAGAAAVGLVAVMAITLKPNAKPAVSVSQPNTLQPTAAAGDALHVELADGSEVWLRDRQARVRVEEVAAARVSLELEAGQARFDVMHREERKFRVQSGDVTVEVLGTAFELERELARTRVLVLRGRVAVIWPDGRTELAAGEAGWFPRPELASAAARSDTGEHPAAAQHAPRQGSHDRTGLQPTAASDRSLEPATHEHRATTSRRAQPGGKPAAATGRAAGLGTRAPDSPAATTWRDPAEQGDFDHAYELLARSARPVADDVEELLLAADTARLSGHPEEALPFLRGVIDRHTRDSRAALAAFTLGGVLMQQLGQPREAEAAYARARAMSLNASLAQDALARQVEAAHRAGDSAHARELAHEYLDQYPSGRRVHAVQRFGGLAH